MTQMFFKAYGLFPGVLWWDRAQDVRGKVEGSNLFHGVELMDTWTAYLYGRLYGGSAISGRFLVEN